VVEARAEAVAHKAKVDEAKAKAAKAKAVNARAAKAKAVRVASSSMATVATNLVEDMVTKLEIATNAKPTCMMGSMTRMAKARALLL
jgi:hypothetical protein